MKEIKNILERAKLDKMITYFDSGADYDREMIESYDKILEGSYKEIFDQLEELYSYATREDDQLFDIITKFADTHDELYFQVGVLAGFQIYKDIECGRRCFVEKMNC